MIRSLALALVLVGCAQPGAPTPSSADPAARTEDGPLALQLGALDGAPRTIPYGGYVDFDGEPVNASGVAFNFALFPCDTVGACAPLWVARGGVGTWTSSVESIALPIFSGRFAVELGGAGQNALPEVVFTDTHAALYLGVRIEGRTLGHLQRLAPAFRSTLAAEADRLRVRTAITIDDPIGGGARISAEEGIVIDHDGALAPEDTLLRVGAGAASLSVTGQSVIIGGSLHVAKLAVPPAGCGAGAGGGLMYFDAAAGLRVCNGDAWVAAAVAGRGLAGMPVMPAQYGSFSTLATSADTATWHATGRTVPTNTGATWDAGEKAYRTQGTSATYIDSGWRPWGAAKTACVWKKYWDATAIVGIDGYQVPGAYFYYGTYGAPPRWYFYSASNGTFGSDTSPAAPTAGTWTFLCLASSGAGGTTQLYAAIAGDTQPVLRHFQAVNGGDAGHVGDASGMRYGALSSQNEAWSKAFYGGFYHFDASLTAAQVKQVWEATRHYYPGHGAAAR